jgi:hypothetical protein
MKDTNKPLGQPSFIQLVCQNSFAVQMDNTFISRMSKKELKKLQKTFAKRRHSKLI